MAKKLHLVHVKSAVPDKAPSASTIEYGEIAVNYNSETPALYIKDDEDNIVKFISEPYFTKIVGTGITENDGETITPLTEVIEQDEIAISSALNDLNDRKTDKGYVDGAISGVTADIDGLSDEVNSLSSSLTNNYYTKNEVDYAIEESVIDVDDHLDSASTNPVENRAIYEWIVEDELTVAAAINDLNNRKADTTYVDNAISSVEIDVDSQLDSASTNPVENRVLWSMFEESEVTTNKVTTLTSANTNTQYASAKATYDEIHPKIVTENPSTGFLPNVFYNLGTLTGAQTFTFASPADTSVVNHYYWAFDTGTTAPTITWPASITGWNGGSAPTINASKHYEISVLNGIGAFMEV